MIEDIIANLKNRGIDTSDIDKDYSVVPQHEIYDKPRALTQDERRDEAGFLGELEMLPATAGLGVLKGFGNIVQGAQSAANDYLPSSLSGAINTGLKGIGAAGSTLTGVPNPFDPNADFSSMVPAGKLAENVRQANPVTDFISQGVGETLPFLPVLGAGSAALEGAPAIARLGGAAAKNAGAFGLQGALLNPEDRERGAITNAVIGGALGAGGEYLARGLEPKNFDVYEASQRLRKAGIDANLGAGISSDAPLLNTLQSGINRLPVGAVSDTHKAVSNLEQGVGTHLNYLLGDTNPQEINTKLQSSLKEVHEAAKEQDNTNYKNLNKVANFIDAGDFIEPMNYKNRLVDIMNRKNYLGENSPGFELTEDPKLMKFLDKEIRGPDEINFNLARVREQKLNELASDAYGSGNNTLGSLYTSIKYAQRKDIEDSMQNITKNGADPSNAKALQDAWNISRQYHAENVAPFDSPEMQKFLKRNADPDLMLQTFLKTGQSDRPTLLNKLMDKLPQKDRSLFQYAYLTRGLPKDAATGEANVKGGIEQVMKNYQKLQSLPNTRSILFGNSEPLLKDISTVYNAATPNLKAHPVSHNLSLGGLGYSGLEYLNHGGLAEPATAGSVLGGGAIFNKILRSPKLQSWLYNNPKALSNLVDVPSKVVSTLGGNLSSE